MSEHLNKMKRHRVVVELLYQYRRAVLVSDSMPVDSLRVEASTATRTRKQRSKIATYVCLVWFLGFRAFGNLALAWGTKHFSEALTINPLTYMRAMLNPFVAAGILLLVGGMLSRMALLSLADLSFVLPMTSVGYVISSVFGRVFLHETVTPERWLGVGLIFFAALLVGSTSQNTTQRRASDLPPTVPHEADQISH